jgi:opacity protein-like surface antigen
MDKSKLTTMINFFKVAIILLVSNSCFGQDKSERRFEYYFNTSFGLYLPNNAPKALAKSGVVYTFQFQVNFKHNYFGRLYVDQYSVNYRDTRNLNGLQAKIDDDLDTNTYGIDLGYTFIEASRFSPYVYLGGGFATMKTPVIDYNSVTNNVTTSKSSKNFLNYRIGLGAEYEISKMFILTLETQYNSIPFKTDLDNKQLNGTMILIGFKTALQ